MQLRTYQLDAINAVFEHLKTKTTHPIVSAVGAAGKSIMIAKIAEALNEPSVVLADRKRLLRQNESKFHPDCDIGVVSAGLDRWEYNHQIVIGGIQTLYNKAHLLGERKYIIIDECDLVSNTPTDDTMYWQLIRQFPKVKIIGLTGTPFRTGEGKLTWGEICYSVTYKDLLALNYVAPITNKIEFRPDLKDVKKSGGDYTENSLKEKYLDVNNSKDWESWINKLAIYGKNRKSWLVFLPTIEHAEKMAFSLAAIGILARAVTSKTKDIEKIYSEFESGELQCLVSVGIIERGTDFPFVDFLADFSPTKSLKKWDQRIWRGIRLSPETGKTDCFYADFAGNLKEHGSINNTDWLLENGEIKIKKKYTEKPCPSCETFIPIFAKVCQHCNYEILTEEQKKRAYDDADFERDINKEPSYADKIKWYTIDDVEYEPYWQSKAGNKMLKVVYKIGFNMKVYEFVFNNQEKTWLFNRGHRAGEVKWGELKKPKKIQVDLNPKYPKILKYEFA
jgi:DNA repair protein RadD